VVLKVLLKVLDGIFSERFNRTPKNVDKTKNVNDVKTCQK